MTGPRGRRPPRRLWATVALYVVLLAVIAADAAAVTFWASVGGTIGLSIAAAAAVVILVLGGLLLTDAYRQWRRHRRVAGIAGGGRTRRPTGPEREAQQPVRASTEFRPPRRPIYRR